MPRTPETFAERLKTLRAAAAISQAELARRIGSAQANIANMELGKREPTWGTLCKLADALGVSIASFRP